MRDAPVRGMLYALITDCHNDDILYLVYFFLENFF